MPTNITLTIMQFKEPKVLAVYKNIGSSEQAKRILQDWQNKYDYIEIRYYTPDDEKIENHIYINNKGMFTDKNGNIIG